MNIDSYLFSFVEKQSYPLLFATISGAHLYGFPSPDSDYDLRGSHILPIKEVLGLYQTQETIQIYQQQQGLELDFVSHDVKKFFSLLLKPNGYVLEQLYSPLIVYSSPEHQELKAIAVNCITRHHYHHYLGFARSQWRLFEKKHPRQVKPLLYVYRVLLTGIHLMETGWVESNLVKLNDIFKLSYISDLIQRKLSGGEKSLLAAADGDFYQREYERLGRELETAFNQSKLPEYPSGKAEINDLLVRLRIKLSFGE